MLRSMRRSIARNVGKRIQRDLIGQVQRLTFRMSGISARYSRDWTVGDYAFWDKARRGKAKGLELSGLFLKPLGSKAAAWVIGRRPMVVSDKSVSLANATNNWLRENHADIARAMEESLDLGDSYLVLNGDRTLTIVPPHVVVPIVSDDDYSDVIGWRITEKFKHPTETGKTQVIIDEYTPGLRVRIIEVDGIERSRQTFRNNLTVVPVIHLPNLQSADEMFGRPEGEALVPALQAYGEIFDAAINGNIRQGRPTPVISKMGSISQVAQFWRRFGRTETKELPDGTTESTEVVDFDSDQLLTLGGESEFDWKSPNSFSQDTETLLGLIFYLVLQHTEIPEFVWGNAIGSSKASAESQLAPFVRWIEKKRALAQKWLTELLTVVIEVLRNSDPALEAADDLKIEWEALTERDGRLTLDTIVWAHNRGLLTNETALRLAPVSVDDPRLEVMKGRKEWENDPMRNQPATFKNDTDENSAPRSSAEDRPRRTEQSNPLGEMGLEDLLIHAINIVLSTPRKTVVKDGEQESAGLKLVNKVRDYLENVA